LGSFRATFVIAGSLISARLVCQKIAAKHWGSYFLTAQKLTMSVTDQPAAKSRPDVAKPAGTFSGKVKFKPAGYHNVVSAGGVPYH